MPPVRIVIAGATHIGQMLAALARQIGYDVVVVDPRAAFASEERFGATELVDRLARRHRSPPSASTAARRSSP